MTDRFADGYEPRFDIDYQFGRQAELFVSDIIKSIGTERVEVKHDAMYRRTGNIYVETSCKRNGRYQPSGITTTQTEFWAFVLAPGMCVFVLTETLRAAAEHLSQYEWNCARCDKGSHPTCGVKVPLRWLLQQGIGK